MFDGLSTTAVASGLGQAVEECFADVGLGHPVSRSLSYPSWQLRRVQQRDLGFAECII